MRELKRQVQILTARVEQLERQNGELRDHVATADDTTIAHETRFDRRDLLRLGGAAAAFGAGSVLLSPEAADAATGAMQFGTNNDSGTDSTGITSANPDNTLHVVNTGAGESIHAVNTSPDHATLKVVAAGAGGAVFAEANSDSDQAGPAVFGGGTFGGGVVGATAGPGPGLGALATADTGPAFFTAVFDPATQDFDIIALTQATWDGFYSEISRAQSDGRAVWGRTFGTGSSVRQHLQQPHDVRGCDGGCHDRNRAGDRRHQQQGRRRPVQREDRAGAARPVDDRVYSPDERFRRAAARRQVEAPLVLPGRDQLEAARLSVCGATARDCPA
jgi:hypothetical protein